MATDASSKVHLRGLDEKLHLLFYEVAGGGKGWQEDEVDGATLTLTGDQFESLLEGLDGLQEDSDPMTDYALSIDRLREMEIRGTDVDNERVIDLIFSGDPPEDPARH